jgi:hypothetical protein
MRGKAKQASRNPAHRKLEKVTTAAAHGEVRGAQGLSARRIGQKHARNAAKPAAKAAKSAVSAAKATAKKPHKQAKR